ncbi:MAG: head-tail adaptor protein [Candidatus Omnitrophica bacterium]|jgi:hypothetical protein|nr:head-tail adaptor protein [Candidatus Omnitrophota bacterium]
MELYETIRNQQADLIEQNKASIVISRITRTDDGAGGWNESTANLTSQDFRIYNKRSRVLNINEGGWHSQRVTKLIAKYNANVKAESETYLDKFSYGGKTYKITDVKDIYTQNYVVFKECELEEIS